MKSNPLDNLLTLEETAAYVCTKLKEKNIDVVLSGGSCMEIYTKSNFSSLDIDFIPNPTVTSKQIEKTMLELGFKKTESRYYKYDNNPNYIEFPTGPVSLGNDLTKEFAELKTHVGTLTLLTPTDCVKDRLCALIYHNGEECFNQAIAVAHLNIIDKENLIDWARKENNKMLEKVNILFEDLNILNKTNITSEDIIIYLNSKAKNLYLDIYKESDFEDLKDDLLDNYVLRQILEIKKDIEYYPTMDSFFRNYLK
ncbi:hypothetical protein [Poseidonibacter ostreae]|uniref:Nucleotidyl transferase AbiEii/AbiGii toxin family protein n=1 Tax=Poseidonibacter ostreae TaxID=2654171 RepID=A0A6L4WV38_9BACT|nr:hypothetical protein [Poseidonibacter ostreae]KAB7881967.1 hypothetical protein GA417_13920 [Poseidonibacter ostreae]KAB7888939.1 hypothetical protein GBG18_11930 [Poseidonibacter ostreae]KAB7890315.1 hypothetical protein GBG19_03560 [Poseidonibacter ostreae]